MKCVQLQKRCELKPGNISYYHSDNLKIRSLTKKWLTADRLLDSLNKNWSRLIFIKQWYQTRSHPHGLSQISTKTIYIRSLKDIHNNKVNLN